VVVGRVDGLELLAEEVAEVGDGVGGVPDEEVLGLLAVVLLAVDVRQDGGDLAVWESRESVRGVRGRAGSMSGRLTSVLVRNDLGLVVDEVRDGAVGVAKGDADGSALAWLRARLSPGVTHCC
jgi:hypothetical protein